MRQYLSLLIAVIVPACASMTRQRDDGSTADAADSGALCGNGQTDPGEDCDDGNTVSGDGCSADCRTEVCDAASCPLGCCDQQGSCQDGTQDLACGTGGAACESCTAQAEYCQDQTCQELAECSPGDTLGCGNCGTRTCSSWSTWGQCEQQGVCFPGTVEITGSCGNCGRLQRTCLAGCTWGELACVGEGECAAGSVEAGAACDTCKRDERICDPATCTWGAWTCVPYEECTPGAVDVGGDCGTRCGHEERECTSNCTWTTYQCVDEGDCSPGDVQQGGSCGTLCGHQEQECLSSCTWGSWQCVDEGVCSPSSQESCTSSCGTSGTHTCSSSCQWNPCTPPDETCNAADDDCDSTIDTTSCFKTLYRHYNSSTGDHMFKASTTPDPGYVVETPDFKLYTTQVPGTIPLYQRYNSGIGDHLQTTSPTEGDSGGYTGAEILGYAITNSGWSAAGYSTTQLYRYYCSSSGDHFVHSYIDDANLPTGYVREGPTCWVWSWTP